jgi:hypothetical protein
MRLLQKGSGFRRGGYAQLVPLARLDKPAAGAVISHDEAAGRARREEGA